MHNIHDGQCGLCRHFGEEHPVNNELLKIRKTHQVDGDDDYTDDCGHPKHASLHLKVTPISGCDGFEPAAEAGRA